LECSEACDEDDPDCEECESETHDYCDGLGWDGYDFDDNVCYRDETKEPCDEDRDLVKDEDNNWKCRKYVCKISRQDWDDAQRAIKAKIDKATKAREEYDNQMTRINILNGDRLECDNWINENEYLEDPSIDISVNADGELGLKQDRYALIDRDYVSSDPNFEEDRYKYYEDEDKIYKLYTCEDDNYYHYLIM